MNKIIPELQMNINKSQIQHLIVDILQKKELADIDPLFVLFQIEKYFQYKPHAHSFIPITENSKKSKEYKQIIKDIRQILRRFHGLFQQEKKSTDFQVLLEMIDGVQDSSSLKIVAQDILSIHASTLERLSLYKQLYHDIFCITGVPETIVDLGCGLNPVSLVFMHILEEKKKMRYLAYDINKKERELLESFFEKAHSMNTYFSGYCAYLNLLNSTEIEKIPKADVCFLFKVTDILDQGKGHKTTENIITSLNTTFIVLSFPTKTMSGKKMTAPKRNWVKLLCDRLGYNYTILEYQSEIVYVIEKSK